MQEDSAIGTSTWVILYHDCHLLYCYIIGVVLVYIISWRGLTGCWPLYHWFTRATKTRLAEYSNPRLFYYKSNAESGGAIGDTVSNMEKNHKSQQKKEKIFNSWRNSNRSWSMASTICKSYNASITLYSKMQASKINSCNLIPAKELTKLPLLWQL